MTHSNWITPVVQKQRNTYRNCDIRTNNMTPAPLAQEHAVRFMLAGYAIFTIVSRKTGTRFTYRVSAAKHREGLFYVSVLTGPDNTRDYQYVGIISKEYGFRHGRKSGISEDAPSVQAFRWTVRKLLEGSEIRNLEIWHAGRCGKCNRLLTDPESVATGLGPICRGN